MFKREFWSQISLRTFLTSLFCIVFFIVFGLFDQESLARTLSASLDFISDNFGALILFFGLAVVFLVVGLSLTRVGEIRLGGPEAKPDFSYTTWFAISLNGCIGTGILFWAMGEPIFHMAQPPAAAGVEAFSREAAIFAVSQTFTHWTIVQYSLYTFCGVVVGLISWNFHRILGITTILENFFSPKTYALIKDLGHVLCICCIAGAVSCSMGVGIMQIGSGLKYVGISESGPEVWFFIALSLAAVYITSSLIGIKKGLSFLSQLCTVVFVFLMFYLVLFGPTRFIMDLSVSAFGSYLNHFVEHSLILPTMVPEERWSAQWNVQFVASFFVYAPILGLFLARLGKGRTVREFVWMNIFAPSMFCVLWIGAWAGLAVWCQWTGTFDLWSSVQQNGMESTIFMLLNMLPYGKELCLIFLVAVFFSFSTLGDAITGTMAILSTKTGSVCDEPPALIKALWGACIALVSYVLIVSGGQDSVRSLFTIIGLPMAGIVLVYVWYVFCYSSYLFGELDNFQKYRVSGLEEKWNKKYGSLNRIEKESVAPTGQNLNNQITT